ncbi:MAG: hypothetical protein GY906_11445 [bacterium]|nr:hypothetical protein [bacterium]
MASAKRKGKKARPKNRNKRAQKPSQNPEPAKKILKYASPTVLADAGPLIEAAVVIPDQLVAPLKAAGKPIPSPVKGFMLIDTGASRTHISEETAAQLNLKPVGSGATYGAGGLHKRPVYQVKVIVPIDRIMLGTSLQVLGIPDLEKPYRNMGTKAAETGEPIRVIGLLGRDFLRHTVLIYGGAEGRVEIWVDEDTS